MDSSITFIGSILFLLSISSTSLVRKFYTMIKKDGSYLKLSHPLKQPENTMTTSKLSKYSTSLVILDLPQDNHDNMKMMIKNDDIIAQVVKDTSSNLYVYLNYTQTTKKQQCLVYISHIYSRLWDEIVSGDKLELKCYVTCEALLDVHTTQMFKDESLQAIYCHTHNHQLIRNEIISIRQQSNLLGLLFEDTSMYDLPNTTSTTTTTNTSTHRVYYLDDSNCDIPTYNKVALGGSFDQLHNGHRKLLTLASAYCNDTLIIGITGDSMLQKKKYANIILSYEQRKKDVITFLRTIYHQDCHYDINSKTCIFTGKRNIENIIHTPPSSSSSSSSSTSTTAVNISHISSYKASTLGSNTSFICHLPSLEIHELHEPYGPAIVDPTIEALVVSSETLLGASKINEIRQDKGMKLLDILILRRTDISILSSTFIREKIIK